MDANTDLAAWLHHATSPPGAPRAEAVPAVVDAPRAPSSPGDVQSMTSVIAEANAELAKHQTGLRFVQLEALPRPVIQIVDQASGEVLRQIPDETAVRIAQALTGLLIDRHA
jgi:flagellar protein FlaG